MWKAGNNRVAPICLLHRKDKKILSCDNEIKKKSTSKDETKKAEREQQIKDAYSDYIDLVESYCPVSKVLSLKTAILK